MTHAVRLIKLLNLENYIKDELKKEKKSSSLHIFFNFVFLITIYALWRPNTVVTISPCWGDQSVKVLVACL